MPKTIAILGASGTIGTLCVEEFTERGDTVLACGRTARASRESGWRISRWTTRTRYSYNVFLSGPMRCSWRSGIEYLTAKWREFWVPFAEGIARAVRKTQTRTVFFDNVYAYGLVEGVMTEETPYNPVSRKGEVRRDVDVIFDELIAEGLPVVVAKAPDFYGPGAVNSFFGPRFHEQLAAGKFEWFGDPELEHTLGYVPDFPPALHALLHAQSTGVYHLPVSDEPMSAARIKSILEQQTGRHYKYSLIRGPLARVLGWIMPMLGELWEMRYQYEHPYLFNADKIKEEFPKLRTTSLEAGVQAQYAHYRDNKKST